MLGEYTNKKMAATSPCQLQKEETHRIVQHQLHQATSVSMWWCLGLSMTVWPHIPVNATQSRNICSCSAFNPSNRYVTICGGLRLCISVCGGGYLSTEYNEKTIRNVEQLTHEVMCGNMWCFFSLHLSVWMWIPVNRPQWRNNRNCCALEPSSDCFNMWYSDYLSLSVWIQIPVDSMQRRNNRNC